MLGQPLADGGEELLDGPADEEVDDRRHKTGILANDRRDLRRDGDGQAGGRLPDDFPGAPLVGVVQEGPEETDGDALDPVGEKRLDGLADFRLGQGNRRAPFAVHPLGYAPDALAGAVRLWFSARADTALLGPLFQQDWFVWAVTYGGILFDLLIVPALLWRRTRFAAFLVSIGFHLFNSVTFRIGTFPYLALAFSFFFFAPRIARRLLRRPAFAGATEGQVASSRSPRERVVLVALALYFVVQIALPLRHWLYPGQVYWNEDGHRMSWRMMTRHKQGYVTFRLHDPESGRTWNVRPGDRLSQKQARRIGSRPDMIWQFAQRLAAESRAAGELVEVRANGMVSLNGRTFQPLVDPEVDLASTRWNLIAPTEWIVPLRNRNQP